MGPNSVDIAKGCSPGGWTAELARLPSDNHAGADAFDYELPLVFVEAVASMFSISRPLAVAGLIPKEIDRT